MDNDKNKLKKLGYTPVFRVENFSEFSTFILKLKRLQKITKLLLGVILRCQYKVKIFIFAIDLKNIQKKSHKTVDF